MKMYPIKFEASDNDELVFKVEMVDEAAASVLIKTNKNGIPDLLCLKDGKGFFIEVKSEKGKVKPLQHFRHEELLKYGFETLIKRS